MTPSDLAHYRDRFHSAGTPADVKAILDEVKAKHPGPEDIRARTFCHELATAIISEAPELLGLEPEGQANNNG